jgi:hypothetical protein
MDRSVLTWINEELIRETRMIDIMDGGREQGGSDFQWCEHGL